MKTNKTSRTPCNIKLLSNFKNIKMLVDNEIPTNVITHIFNNDVFKDNPITIEGMQVLIDYNEQLRTRCIPKKKINKMVSVIKSTIEQIKEDNKDNHMLNTSLSNFDSNLFVD